jgi:hypothetical protein
MARNWVRVAQGERPDRGDYDGFAVAELADGAGDGEPQITILGGDQASVEEIVRLVENGAKASAAFEQHMAGKRISYFVSYTYRHPENGLPAFGCSSVGVDFPGLERFDQVAGIAAQISETIRASAVILSWQRCDPPLVVAPVTA